MQRDQRLRELSPHRTEHSCPCSVVGGRRFGRGAFSMPPRVTWFTGVSGSLGCFRPAGPPVVGPNYHVSVPSTRVRAKQSQCHHRSRIAPNLHSPRPLRHVSHAGTDIQTQTGLKGSQDQLHGDYVCLMIQRAPPSTRPQTLAPRPFKCNIGTAVSSNEMALHR